MGALAKKRSAIARHLNLEKVPLQRCTTAHFHWDYHRRITDKGAKNSDSLAQLSAQNYLITVGTSPKEQS